jgi:hypothetical protein
MTRATRASQALITAAALVLTAGCGEEQTKPGASSAQSAAPPPPSAPAPSATAAPHPSASASASAPVHDCPAGSTGDGSMAKPCDAKGSARMMEVTWTGKMTDTGPSFRVINKSPSVILFGKIVVYFYDKAGKQLEVKDSGGKTHPSHPCSGNIFGGVMKPAEKAVITFSCVKKDIVPEGTAHVEAEMQMVGFADASEKKSEYFWRNNDLTPEKRAKGSAK